MTAHCATCSCSVGEDIPRPSVSSEWARRQAKEATEAAVRLAREKRKTANRVTAGHVDDAQEDA